MGRMADREFTRFYNKQHNSLTKYLCKYINNYCDVEELVQETFLIFFDKWGDNYQDNITPNTLLFKIAKDLLKDYWKSSLRSEKVLDFNSRILQNVIKDVSVNIENDYIKNEENLTDIVNEELEHLPALYKDILKKYYYEGMTQEEIADSVLKWQPNISLAITDGERMLKIRLKKRGVKND